MRVAVNFPYFVPYSGYFRLLASTDVFVLFDCVPFPRRGYVHRNQLPDEDNNPKWFTLPLNKAPRDTCIKDMSFVSNIQNEIISATRRFPVLQTDNALQHPLFKQCLTAHTDLVDYLEVTLKITAELLDLPFNIVRSSSLPIDRELKGEKRVLNIVEYLGGTHYINAPGGRHLYDIDNFKKHGIDVNYLDPYQGNTWSILYRLLTEEISVIKKEILKQSL